MPDLNWNGDADTASFSSYYDGGSGNLVLAEDNTGGVVLLEYDDTAGEWVYRADVDLGSNNLTGGDVEATGAFIDSLGNQVSDFESLGGVKYVQTSEPAYVEGDTWLNPDTGVFYVAYNGEWKPVPPVTVTQEASTFTESDVTVSNSGTVVSNGGIELDGVNSGSATVLWPLPSDVKSWDLATYQSTPESGTVVTNVISSDVSNPGTALDLPNADDTQSGFGNGWGIRVNPNRTLGGVEIVLSQNTVNADKAAIIRPNDVVIVSGSWTAGDAVQIPAILIAGVDYDIVVYGSNFDAGRKSSVTYPFTSSDLDVSSSVRYNVETFSLTDSNTNNIYSVTEITGTDTKESLPDIDQNTDISTIPAGSDAALEFELSRPDSGTNPTVDYAARRFTR